MGYSENAFGASPWGNKNTGAIAVLDPYEEALVDERVKSQLAEMESAPIGEVTRLKEAIALLTAENEALKQEVADSWERGYNGYDEIEAAICAFLSIAIAIESSGVLKSVEVKVVQRGEVIFFGQSDLAAYTSKLSDLNKEYREERLDRQEKNVEFLSKHSVTLPAPSEEDETPQRNQPQGKPKTVAVPSAETARLDAPAKKSDAQMKAHQWLGIVVGEVKDHNEQANGDIWQMWALSPRMLKDISGVSQKIVKEFYSENEVEIDALHEHWKLDAQHNRRRGMKGSKVTDDFALKRPMELL